jgi:hypothetical protein
MSGQSLPPRTVFVLDVSGSMSGMKCQNLHLSATRFIEDIPNNNYVGIVLLKTPLISSTESFRSLTDQFEIVSYRKYHKRQEEELISEVVY